MEQRAGKSRVFRYSELAVEPASGMKMHTKKMRLGLKARLLECGPNRYVQFRARAAQAYFLLDKLFRAHITFDSEMQLKIANHTDVEAA